MVFFPPSPPDAEGHPPSASQRALRRIGVLSGLMLALALVLAGLAVAANSTNLRLEGGVRYWINEAAEQQVLAQRLTKIAALLAPPADPASPAARQQLQSEFEAALRHFTSNHHELTQDDPDSRGVTAVGVEAYLPVRALAMQVIDLAQPLLGSEGITTDQFSALYAAQRSFVSKMEGLIARQVVAARAVSREKAIMDLVIFGGLALVLVIQSLFVLGPALRRLRGLLAEDERVKSHLGQLARELETKNHQLDQVVTAALAADSAKSNFLAMMSHEIRTPMNGVMGTAHLLLDTPLNPFQKRLALTIHNSGEILLRVIDDILDFTKIEAGKLSLAREPYSPRRAMAETVELFRPKASSKGLALSFDAEPLVPTTLLGDSARLRQVLGNLVGNAIKFTEEGSVSISCQAQTRSGTRGVLFGVHDTGVGISDEERGRLFQPFEQGEYEKARLYGGTGLGLAICKQLVELMGGRIDVTSAPGEGSVFTFWIPAVAPARRTDGGTAAASSSLPPFTVTSR